MKYLTDVRCEIFELRPNVIVTHLLVLKLFRMWLAHYFTVRSCTFAMISVSILMPKARMPEDTGSLMR